MARSVCDWRVIHRGILFLMLVSGPRRLVCCSVWSPDGDLHVFG